MISQAFKNNQSQEEFTASIMENLKKCTRWKVKKDKTLDAQRDEIQAKCETYKLLRNSKCTTQEWPEAGKAVLAPVVLGKAAPRNNKEVRKAMPN